MRNHNEKTIENALQRSAFVWKDGDTRESIKDIFKDNYTGEFIYKKMQRVSAAAYLITESLDAGEPLRSGIREHALAVVDAALGAAAGYERGAHTTRLRFELSRLCSLLEIAVVSGCISSMNGRLLLHECDSIEQIAAGRPESLAGELTLSGTFFDVTRTTAANDTPIKDKKDTKRTFIKDIDTSKERKETSLKRVTRKPDVPGQGAEARRNTIRSLAREKGRITIKDISALIVDCSEKTLQRELAAMVADGTLKKEGERRWSSYMLAA